MIFVEFKFISVSAEQKNTENKKQKLPSSLTSLDPSDKKINYSIDYKADVQKMQDKKYLNFAKLQAKNQQNQNKIDEMGSAEILYIPEERQTVVIYDSENAQQQNNKGASWLDV